MKPYEGLMRAIVRRKTVDLKSMQDTPLRRVLNVFHVIGIGVGGCLGIGVYVIITYVVKNEAGPSAVLSVLLAGVAALLSGMCYAELATRLPRAGAAYVYAYAVLGELVAFVVGWTIMLENAIGAAAAAKAWSHYLDFILNGTIHKYFREHLHWGEVTGISDSPDILAFGVVLACLIVVTMDVKVSAVASCVFSILNGLVVLCIICVGFFHVKHENWTDPPGFFAYGFSGVLSGAATLFYAFVGPDTIASTSEEAKEPSKTISNAIIATIITTFVLYFGVTCALTLTYPWYELVDNVALPQAYDARGIEGSKYVMGIGGLFGLTAATIGCLFALPRIIYAMSKDKLICKCIGSVNSYTQTPLKAVFISGLITALLALTVCLDTLIEMMAIGTLLSFSVVAVCTVCVRYHPVNLGLYQEYEDVEEYTQCTEFVYAPFMAGKQSDNPHRTVSAKNPSVIRQNESQSLLHDTPTGSSYQKMDSVVDDTPNGSVSSLYNIPPGIPQDPTTYTVRVATVSLSLYIFSCVVLALFTTLGSHYILSVSWWSVTIVIVLIIALITTTALILKQPQNRTRLLFKVPYVPFLPLLSLLLNIFMMSSLNCLVWIRFAMWLLLGLVIYFGFGAKHSAESDMEDTDVILYEIEETDAVMQSGT